MFSVFRAYSLALLFFLFSFSVWVLEFRVCWASFAKGSWGLLGFRGFRFGFIRFQGLGFIGLAGFQGLGSGPSRVRGEGL